MAFSAETGLPLQFCVRKNRSMILFSFLALLPPYVPSIVAQAPLLGRPNCITECGGIKIPYPFGIEPRNANATGFQCAHSVSFVVKCNNGNLTLTEEENFQITSISLEKGQAQVLIDNNRWCDTNPRESLPGRSLILPQSSFKFSHSDNRLTAIGCNVLANVISTFPTTFTGTFGCMATCSNSSDPLLVDGSCSGLGCCQTSIPTGLNFMIFLSKMSNMSIPGLPVDRSSTPTCGYAFMVAANNYTFQKSHLQWQGGRAFPVVLDWFIEPKTCEQAQRDPTRYLCNSTNSVCVNSNSAGQTGYFCNCSQGYQGNPYLPDGCQDVNECEDPKSFPCAGKCQNIPGSYICTLPTKLNKMTGVAIGISCGLGVLLLIFSFAQMRRRYIKKRQKKQRQKFFKHNYDILLRQQLLYSKNHSVVDRIKFFSYQDLEKATSKFDQSRIIGNGGHGTVYKGLMDLQVVAVKRSKVITEIETEQFINEVILLSQINHRNVVKLVGCCLESEVPLLAYEFVANGTLHDRLHSSNQETALSWEDRIRIASEIASALSYLHSAANVSIFHRDIKSSNILLDDKLTAKVSDFGASKTVELDQTHISTNIQGTFGYLDPEYMHTSQLTEKSDVYSMGVMLVELMTGRKPTSKVNPRDERNMISQFIWAFHENKLFEVIDPIIIEETSTKEIETIAQVAVTSLHMRGKDRPTMKEVDLALEGLKKGKKLKKKDSDNYKPESRIFFPDMSSIVPRSGSMTITETLGVQDLVPFEDVAR